MRRHSLATPIDWKLKCNVTGSPGLRAVATHWRHLLIGNRGYLGRTGPKPVGGRHSLATPIDWKLLLSLATSVNCKAVSPLAGDTY